MNMKNLLKCFPAKRGQVSAKKRPFLKKALISLAFIVLAIMLNQLAAGKPGLIEDIYSMGLGRRLIQSLSLASGIFPFSLAEVFLVMILAILLYGLGKILSALASGRLTRSFLIRILLAAITACSFAYLAFVLLWGLNYQRLPFAETTGLTVRPPSSTELTGLCQHLVLRANQQRCHLEEDANGVLRLPYGKQGALSVAGAGFERAGASYPALAGNYGEPKAVYLGEFMSYLGLSGAYSPFTGEANINLASTHAFIPATVCHEAAHQRGYAREYEANYIAYLACQYNPDLYFQYSGTLLALTHAMNSLRRSEPDKHQELVKLYSPGVQRDLTEYQAFWSRHEGILSLISTRANDIYLKTNRQSDGVLSYNRMVDLLLAEYREGRHLRY